MVMEVSNEHQLKIKELYLIDKLSFDKISKESLQRVGRHIARKTVWKVLKKQGVKSRTISETRIRKTADVDGEVITKIKAMWLNDGMSARKITRVIEQKTGVKFSHPRICRLLSREGIVHLHILTKK